MANRRLREANDLFFWRDSALFRSQFEIRMNNLSDLQHRAGY